MRRWRSSTGPLPTTRSPLRSNATARSFRMPAGCRRCRRPSRAARLPFAPISTGRSRRRSLSTAATRAYAPLTSRRPRRHDAELQSRRPRPRCTDPVVQLRDELNLAAATNRPFTAPGRQPHGRQPSGLADRSDESRRLPGGVCAGMVARHPFRPSIALILSTSMRSSRSTIGSGTRSATKRCARSLPSSAPKPSAAARSRRAMAATNSSSSPRKRHSRARWGPCGARIAGNVARIDFVCLNERVPLRVSVGAAAAAPERGQRRDELLRAADDAMFRAKRSRPRGGA